jgi:FkbM family methyltransferase
MRSVIKRLVRRALNYVGLDIVRTSKKPEYTLLGLHCLPVRSVVDVGANTGQFAQRIIRLFPEAHVYCFEPLPGPFDELKQWADQHQGGKVTVFNVALGNREGTVEMFEHLDHSPSSSLLRSTSLCERLYPFVHEQVPIPVGLRTLDSFLADMSISLLPDILIKLDVQGYEDRVIRGGLQTFGKATACILEVSLDPLYEEQTDFKDILVLLDELGYCYAGNLQQSYADDGHVVYIDAVFIRKADDYGFRSRD